MIPGCPHSDIVALSLRSKETVPTPTFGLKAKPFASHLLKVNEEHIHNLGEQNEKSI